MINPNIPDGKRTYHRTDKSCDSLFATSMRAAAKGFKLKETFQCEGCFKTVPFEARGHDLPASYYEKYKENPTLCKRCHK